MAALTSACGRLAPSRLSNHFCTKKWVMATVRVTGMATRTSVLTKYSVIDMPSNSAATLELPEPGPRSREPQVPITTAAESELTPACFRMG
ncbi:hypothetical protein D3C80_1387260 [compost metagenome]